MSTQEDISTAFHRFRIVAERFCVLIDSSPNLARAEVLLRVYVVLPELIQRAIELPDLEIGDDEVPRQTNRLRLGQSEWMHLYERLKEKLGGWNLYRDVFDPTNDTQAIHGSLADDLSDIYRDIKEGVDSPNPVWNEQRDMIWDWRFGYYSHWGQHAMGALRTIHWLLANEPEFVSFR